ncbi:hypothetical protein [Burkholderia metallica]|uniref:hypothetical protein n=1 Tax=Burkholderia metallica TaxID=488729 RepID=UPI001CF50329|nr:hypothetical protein [Burkholderia metallica]MCA8001376.1 hypothetical protein [Burkholderia metallica]
MNSIDNLSRKSRFYALPHMYTLARSKFFPRQPRLVSASRSMVLDVSKKKRQAMPAGYEK